MSRIIIFFLFSVCFSSTDRFANDISGVWINSDKDAHIKIFSSYGKFYGQVVWMKFPIDSLTKNPQLDKFNKDPLLRKFPVMNMIVLKDLVFDNEQQEWNGGTIYNPKSGSSYDVFCKLFDEDVLTMRFFMTARSLGKTFNWVRLNQQ